MEAGSGVTFGQARGSRQRCAVSACARATRGASLVRCVHPAGWSM